jgi:hypothetical protein
VCSIAAFSAWREQREMARGFRSPFRLREHLDSIAKDGEKIFNQWEVKEAFVL